MADIQDVAEVALEAGNSPQMIFKHYRELVRPADAKKWFASVPGTEGKVIYLPKARGQSQEIGRPVQKCELGRDSDGSHNLSGLKRIWTLQIGHVILVQGRNARVAEDQNGLRTR
ncbi:MAG: hypothetical protein AAB676_08350 [Verrucomicrobiota bacterium]